MTTPPRSAGPMAPLPHCVSPRSLLLSSSFRAQRFGKVPAWGTITLSDVVSGLAHNRAYASTVRASDGNPAKDGTMAGFIHTRGNAVSRALDRGAVAFPPRQVNADLPNGTRRRMPASGCLVEPSDSFETRSRNEYAVVIGGQAQEITPTDAKTDATCRFRGFTRPGRRTTSAEAG